MIKKYNNFIKESKTTDDVYIGGGVVFNDIDNLYSKYYCFIKENDKYVNIGSIDIIPSYDDIEKDTRNKNQHFSEIYLGSFDIKEEYRGKGYGEKFLKHFIDKLGEWNIDYLTLYVSRSNFSVSKLYKKLGFEFFNEQNYYIYDMEDRTPHVVELWMVKKMK